MRWFPKIVFATTISIFSLIGSSVNKVQAVSLDYAFTQSGWEGGGILSGSFSSVDKNNDGLIYTTELNTFDLIFSGNSKVPQQKWLGVSTLSSFGFNSSNSRLAFSTYENLDKYTANIVGLPYLNYIGKPFLSNYITSSEIQPLVIAKSIPEPTFGFASLAVLSVGLLLKLKNSR
ncbi:hypothetical protein [Nostoc sp. GT001]|nr:hypothetical protein [Nostoc sp. GT001]MDM9581747.1 hypothetical protein [Nostoc sp. GT001]